jgi:uncharacterized protein (TIGR02598 family)
MKRSSHATDAFSMIEMVVALGVAAFCLIAVFGLMPVGVQTNQRSTSQTAATGILSSVIADMRATPLASATTTQYQITIGTPTPPTPPVPKRLYFNGEGQFVSNSPAADSRYRLDVTFPANPAGANAATFAYLRVTWPAATDPATNAPGGSNEMFAAMSRN